MKINEVDVQGGEDSREGKMGEKEYKTVSGKWSKNYNERIVKEKKPKPPPKY